MSQVTQLGFDYSVLDSDLRDYVERQANLIRTCLRRSAEDIVAIGQALTDVKEELEHGQFGVWIEVEFQMSDRMARNFMRVYETFKTENFSDLSFAPSALYALAAPSTPPEAREEALSLARNGTAISHKDAREIIGSHKAPSADRDPVPFPDPVPEVRVVEASRALYDMVERSDSTQRISTNREIKRPFEYEGKFYVSNGGGWGSDIGEYREATRVVPLTEWPGRPNTLQEVRDRSANGPCYYFGMKVSQGVNEYVLDPRDRIKFVLVDDAPEDEEEARRSDGTFAPIWKMEGWVRNWLASIASVDHSLQKKLLENISNGVAGAFTQLIQSKHIQGPYRKHELKQAVNNVLEQLRQEEQWLQEVPEPAVEVSEGTSSGGRLQVHYSSDRQDWETPQDLFDELHAEFRFDVDVCANEQNYKHSYYSEEDDALTLDWNTQTCWMNPPYGRAIGEWVKKAYESARAGATVVCLLPARTDTRWWWDYVICGEVRFLKGRLRFVGAENGAPFPSAVVVFRPGVLAPDSKVVWWEREGGELDDA